MSKRDTAKLVQFQRGQAQKRSASSTAKAFTSKQSHYARRSEEEAISQQRDLTLPTAATVDTKFASQHARNAAPTFIGRTRKTNFGLNDDSDNLLRMERGLGQTYNNGGVSSSGDSQVPRDGESGEPLNDKKARYEEILNNAKDSRAEKKVLRNEQERETDKLDEDFNDVSKLLRTKSRKEEIQEEFYTLGSDKTRARLAEFFTERNALKGRQFVLGADKKLQKMGVIVSKNELNRREKRMIDARNRPQEDAVAAGEENDENKVDPRIEGLLHTLPKDHQMAVAARAKNSDTKSQILTNLQKKEAEAQKQKELNNQVEDSFDQLLGQMIFSKKAYAGDKTLSADDELLERFQEEVVDLDRSKKDTAGRLVPEVQDRSRREWLARGGDDVYRMGADEDDAENLSPEELRKKAKLKNIEQIPPTRQEQLGESDDDDDLDEDLDFDGDVDYDNFDIDVDGIRPKKGAKIGSKKKTSGSSALQDDAAAADDDDNSDDDQGEEEEPTMNPVDVSLAELEEAFNASKKSKDPEPIRKALQKLHEVSSLRPRMAAESFRLLFLDIHAHHSQRRHLTPFHLLTLRAATNMFPMTDVSRHPVAAPLSALLPSLMFSGPSLETPRDAAVVLFLASTMMDLLSGGARRGSEGVSKPFFAAEPYVAILNVLCLQMPLSELAPKGKSAKLNAPFPVFLRSSDAILSSSTTSSNNNTAAVVEDLSLTDILFSSENACSRQSVLRTAYSLMHHYLDNFLRHNPSCPSLIQDNITNFLIPRLQKHNQTSKSSETLVKFGQTLIDEVLAERAPLAMRTFRPRPLRQYEPLLLDDSEDAVKERRVIKKELREGKKRVIRSVQAEADVERRKTERESRLEDAHRSSKYNMLMAELQNQQHIMNHVDMVKAKGKAKMKKGVSGDYDKQEGGGEGGGGDE